MSMESKNGMLYPLMILAAISVIIFSVVGIATMTGQVPSAFSSSQRTGEAPRTVGPMAVGEQQMVYPAAPPQQRKETGAQQARRTGAVAECGNCGVVESIRQVEVKGQGTGLGLAVGGVTGGLMGNQIGHGGGRTVATIAGATNSVVVSRRRWGYVFDRFYIDPRKKKKYDRCCMVTDCVHQAALMYEKFVDKRTRKPIARIRRQRGANGQMLDEPMYKVIGAGETDYRDLKRLFERNFLNRPQDELSDDIGLRMLVGQ